MGVGVGQEGGTGHLSRASLPSNTWLFPTCQPSVVHTSGSWVLPHFTPVQTQYTPLAQPRAGTAVCKAASLSCAVPKVAPFLLATMKARGELNCEGLPVNPGQCPDFPSSKVHAYTGTYPAIVHLQTCLLGECLLT